MRQDGKVMAWWSLPFLVGTQGRGPVRLEEAITTAISQVDRTRSMFQLSHVWLVVVLFFWGFQLGVYGTMALGNAFLVTAVVGVALCGTTLVRYIPQLAVVVLVLSVVLQVYEHLTGHYVWTSQVEVTGEWISRDENLYTGMRSTLRAKGLFPGPITASMYGVAVVALTRGKGWIWLLALVHALLASGRAAVLVLVAGSLLIGVVTGGAVLQYARRWSLPLLIVLVGIWLILPVALRGNLLQAFDLTDSRNQGRFYYWKLGLHYWTSGGPIRFLLGQPGGTYDTFGNSSESSFIQLLADNGLIGALLLTWIFVLCYRICRPGSWTLLYVVTGFMNASFGSLIGGGLLWLVAINSASATSSVETEAKSGIKSYLHLRIRGFPKKSSYP